MLYLQTNKEIIVFDGRSLHVENKAVCTYAGFCLLGGGGEGKLLPPKVFLKKNLKLFQIKTFFDDDFKESVKVTNVQKCNFSQS